MCAPLFLFVAATISAASPDVKFLAAKGKDIADSDGKTVAMRGVNFGSWLMMETWIPSIAKLKPENFTSIEADAAALRKHLNAPAVSAEASAMSGKTK